MQTDRDGETQGGREREIQSIQTKGHIAFKEKKIRNNVFPISTVLYFHVNDRVYIMGLAFTGCAGNTQSQVVGC